MNSTNEHILSTRDLVSKLIMRPVLCKLYRTREDSSYTNLGCIGNVKFENHLDFSEQFTGPNGKYYRRAQSDLKKGLTGSYFWSDGATKQNFRHIYAMGDVHGDLLSLMSAMFLAKLINADGEWIAKQTLFLQLGDLLDRQRPGLSRARHSSFNPREEIDIIQYLYFIDREARKYGSRVVSITGNHDLWPIEGPAMSVRKGYVGYPLQVYGSMRKRDQYWRSAGMRNYMAWYRPPVMKVNNWLAMHGGISPTNLHRCMKQLMENGNDQNPIEWISNEWEKGMLNPNQNFPSFVLDAMYNRYWATNPNEQDQEECSEHMMTMLRHFGIPKDGGLFMGHTPMFISKCGQRDSSEFHGVEVVCNRHCKTSACGGVLIDVAASEGFREPLTAEEMKNSALVREFKEEDIRSTSVAHVDVQRNVLQRIVTDHMNQNQKTNIKSTIVRNIQQFNGHVWKTIRQEKLSKTLFDHIRSYDSICEIPS